MKRLIDLKIALAGVLLASSITVSAQDISEKRVQAGLTTNLGMNLITMGTTRMDASGIGGNFSIGIVMHSAFKSSKNLGIATGLDFDFATQKYSTKVPTFYRYSDTDILKKEDSGGDV